MAGFPPRGPGPWDTGDMSENNSEYALNWPIIDAGSPGAADTHDIIEGRPPEGREDIPALVYPVLDPNAPENLVNVTAWTKLWYSYLPVFMREADQVQNPLDGGWPMLRWMDSIGHIADGVRATTQDMYDGKWTNPATVPDRAVPWLASVLGVPRSQKNIPGPQLRQVLTDMIENGRAPTGTRTELAAAAKQFLLGEKQAVVRPQVSLPRSLNSEDLALAAAVGYAGRVVAVHVSTLAPRLVVSYVWTGTAHASVSHRYENGTLTAENLVTNPAFAVDTAGWTSTNAAIARNTTTYETGVASMSVTPSLAGWTVRETSKTAPETGTVNIRVRLYSATARSVILRAWQSDGVTPTSTDGPTVALTAGTWTTATMNAPITGGQTYWSEIADVGADTTVLLIDRAYQARPALTAVNDFHGGTPDSVADDIWVNPNNSTVNLWDGVAWTTYTATDVSVERAAVQAKRATETFLRAHTIVIIVRPDEVPDGDLVKFAANLRNVGVVPAGHALVVATAQATWDSYEAAMTEAGGTWADYERITSTWQDNDALGLSDLGSV